jgi:hypothetical protein
MSSDDRPKKTWREVDAARGKSPHRRDPEERSREKASQTAAYSAYKSQLDKLFKPGGTALPEAMRAQLGPPSAESAERRKRAEALRTAPGADTLRACVDAGDPLPDDPRLLTGLLDVRDEALLRAVLSALLAQVEAGKKPNRMLLLQRLTAALSFAEEQETRELAATLKAAVD